MIDEATDTITNAAGGPVKLVDHPRQRKHRDRNGTGCAVGQDISAGNTCTLAFGASLSFQANYYTVQAADASPLLDRADILLQDLCDAVGTTGCNLGAVTVPSALRRRSFRAAPPDPTRPTARPARTPTATSARPRAVKRESAFRRTSRLSARRTTTSARMIRPATPRPDSARTRTRRTARPARTATATPARPRAARQVLVFKAIRRRSAPGHQRVHQRSGLRPRDRTVQSPERAGQHAVRRHGPARVHDGGL